MYGSGSDGHRVENLKDNPLDTIQMLKWMPGNKSTVLAAVGWDAKLRIYELVEGSGGKPRVELKGGVDLGLPVLAVEWVGKDNIVAATADGTIYGIDAKTGNKITIGKADAPVVEIKAYEDREGAALLVFQADEYILLHNVKSNDRFPTSRIKLKYPIIAADMTEFFLAVACHESRLGLIETKDLFGRDPAAAFSYSESSLTSQLTSISLKKVSHIKDSFMVASTIDGRVGILEISTSSYSNTSHNVKSLINFRAAKTDKSGSSTMDVLHHISTIQFLSGGRDFMDNFLTSAANGDVKIWNATKRVDTLTISHKGKQISAARTNDDSSLLAYSVGYTWAQGIWGLKDLQYSPEIYIRILEGKDFVSK